MPDFTYKARNAQGGLVEGVVNCPDRSIAIRQIEQQNCVPIRIEAVGVSPITAPLETARPFIPKLFTRSASDLGDFSPRALKIPHSQLLVFTEQLAHLLQAGMTLDEGLSVLQKRLRHPRVQQMTRTLHH